jgi:hypothetical protein
MPGSRVAGRLLTRVGEDPTPRQVSRLGQGRSNRRDLGGRLLSRRPRSATRTGRTSSSRPPTTGTTETSTVGRSVWDGAALPGVSCVGGVDGFVGARPIPGAASSKGRGCSGTAGWCSPRRRRFGSPGPYAPEVRRAGFGGRESASTRPCSDHSPSEASETWIEAGRLGCRLAWPGSAAQLGGLEEHPMGSRASLLYYFGSSRGGEGREAPVARLQPERGAGPAVHC